MPERSSRRPPRYDKSRISVDGPQEKTRPGQERTSCHQATQEQNDFKQPNADGCCALQVEPQEKKKVPKGRALKRIKYTRRFVNVTMTGGKRKVSFATDPSRKSPNSHDRSR